MSIHAFESTAILSKSLNELLSKAAENAIATRGKFTLALSGGSLCKQLTESLIPHNTQNWEIFFADERCVPLDHEDSNYKGFVVPFFQKLGIPDSQIHTINPNLLGNPAEAAKDYAYNIEKVLGKSPQFDVVLLGMGPDGHTCSLFPGHPLLDEVSLKVASITDSPKPPPQRITLTFPVLNAADTVVFVACGSGKAEMLHEIFDLKKDYPCTRVKAKNILWYVDKPAIEKLVNVEINKAK